MIALIGNCDISRSSTTIFSTAFQSSVDIGSLEEYESEEHNRETNVDGDDHGPVWEGFFDNWDLNFLVSKFKVLINLA